MGMAVRRYLAVLVAAVLVVGLAGCSDTAPAEGPRSLPTGSCPRGGPGGAATIDYVDFVVHAGRMFTSTSTGPGDAVPADRIGPTVAKVSCRIADTAVSPEFRYRDGDASYLPVGTELHRVAGYRDSFRLTAKADDGLWRLFEPSVDDSARTGADLLDLSPGVTAVRLLDPASGVTSASLAAAFPP